MKVFVTGVNGQLGHDVMNELNKRGYEGLCLNTNDIYECKRTNHLMITYSGKKFLLFFLIFHY